MVANYSGDVIPALNSFINIDINGNGRSGGDDGADGIDDQGNNVDFSSVSVKGDIDTASRWTDYDSEVDIEVGRTYYGLLEVSAGTALRYENLHIGGDGQGVVSVTGIGSVINLYKEAIAREFSIPYKYATASASQNLWDEVSTSERDGISPNRGSSIGEVIVGGTWTAQGGSSLGTTYGNGLLSISSAGRVEAGDSVTIAGSNATGTLIIDGVASALVQFATNAITNNRRGNVSILDGGSVLARSASYLNYGSTNIGGSLDFVSQIVSGRFLNGEYGTVRIPLNTTAILSVAAGTNLVTTDFLNTPATNAYNLGSIVVEPGATLTLASQTTTQWTNVRRLAADPITSKHGVLTVQGGNLNLPQGFVNYGVINFDRGSNTVTGEITNEAVSGASGAVGIIYITGEGTTVTFTSPITNKGIIVVGPGCDVVFASGITNTDGGKVRKATNCPAAGVFESENDGPTYNQGDARSSLQDLTL